MSSIGKHIESAAGCERCPVRELAICEYQGAAAAAKMAFGSRTRCMSADQLILAEGGEATLVGAVRAGIVRVTKSLADGRQQVVGLLYPGEMFGISSDAKVDFSYECATDAEIWVMNRGVFERVVANCAPLQRRLFLAALDEVAVARERLMLLGCQSMSERLATYLLQMLDRREQLLAGLNLESQKHLAVSAISRRDLASYISTTIESISRQIHALSRRGIIRIIDSSHFEVLNRPDLMALSGLAEHDLRLLRRPCRSFAADVVMAVDDRFDIQLTRRSRGRGDTALSIATGRFDSSQRRRRPAALS
jgi:CRP/FNR family transcriptional regulator